MSRPLIIMHVSALAERVRIAPDPARERAASHGARRPDWRRATEEVWQRYGFTDVHGRALRHLPARAGRPGLGSVRQPGWDNSAACCRQ